MRITEMQNCKNLVINYRGKVGKQGGVTYSNFLQMNLNKVGIKTNFVKEDGEVVAYIKVSDLKY